ncbi:MAG: hypothetical protein JWP02_1856 [Acidimicrobiales bacterium]|nr:hypothetical protein [Acidimicrobiales bacterium]
MNAFLTVVGALVCLVGLADVFLVVLQYDSLGLLAPRLYRLVWTALRVSTQRLPSDLRLLARSMGGPAMIPLTLVLWLGMQVLGFALIFYPAMRGNGFTIHAPLHAEPGVAFSFSMATIASLSFTGVSPATFPVHVFAALETVVGLGMLTLTISYVVNVYRLLQEQMALASVLRDQGDDSLDARVIVKSRFYRGEVVELSAHLRELHRSIVGLHEAYHRYPVLYYFTSRRPFRSAAYVFRMIGGVIAALSWGLPPGHPAHDDPWLQPLVHAYTRALDHIAHTFLRGRVRDDDTHPVDEATFDQARRRGDSDDQRLARFLDLERSMADIAGLRRRPAREAYRSYREWLAFTAKTDAFLEALDSDLAIGPSHVAGHPARDVVENHTA